VENESILRDRQLEKQYRLQGKQLIKEGKKHEGYALMRKETGLKRIAVLPVLCQKLDKNPREVTRMLWDRYKPWRMWIYFGFIGLAATLGMVIYHFWLEADVKRRKMKEAIV
jgi:hypothetical protein